MLLTVVWTGIWKPDWIDAASLVCVWIFGVEMTLTRPRDSAAWIEASSLKVSRTLPAARLSTCGAPLGRATSAGDGSVVREDQAGRVAVRGVGRRVEAPDDAERLA